MNTEPVEITIDTVVDIDKVFSNAESLDAMDKELQSMSKLDKEGRELLNTMRDTLDETIDHISLSIDAKGNFFRNGRFVSTYDILKEIFKKNHLVYDASMMLHQYIAKKDTLDTKRVEYMRDMLSTSTDAAEALDKGKGEDSDHMDSVSVESPTDRVVAPTDRVAPIISRTIIPESVCVNADRVEPRVVGVRDME